MNESINDISEEKVTTTKLDKSHDVNSIHSKEQSMDSNDNITDSSAFTNFYFRFFLTAFLVQFLRFIMMFIPMCFLRPSTNQDEHDNQIAYFHAQRYTYFFNFSFCNVLLFVFDIRATLNYSMRKYRKFGFQIHYTMILVLSVQLVLFVLHIFVSQVYLKFFKLSDDVISLFYTYYYLIQISFIFEFVFLLYARVLNLAIKGRPVIITTLSVIVYFIVLSYLLMIVANIGIKGYLISRITASVFSCVPVVLYTVFSNALPGSIFFFKKESFNLKEIYENFKLYIMFLPIILAWNGAMFFSQDIAKWSSPQDFRVNEVYIKLTDFMFSLIEGNCISIVVLTTYYLGKHTSINLLKQILQYSFILLLILLGIGTIIVIIFEDWLTYLMNIDVSGSQKFNFSLFHSDQSYYQRDLKEKTSKLSIYFFIFIYISSANRLLYSWMRAVNMMFVGLVNPLLSSFIYKILLAILLSKVYELGEMGLLNAYLICDLISLIINIIQYSFGKWNIAVFNLYSINSLEFK